MKKRKTPLPVCETENGNGEQLFFEEVVTVSSNDGIMPPGRNQVEELLQHGAENAISARELKRITGIKTSRALRRQISAEREKGALILSLPTVGYFLPDEGEKGQREVRAYVAVMTARAKHSFRMTNSARRFLAGGVDDYPA